MKGRTFNIQKMSTQDGPGVRTTVFFKGCRMRCLWCSNPESQITGLEIACFKNRCIGCGYCAELCPQGIIDRETFQITDRSKCDLCQVCVKECCTGSKNLVGKDYTVEELLKEILKDKQFYESSGGGVTFSGGEPFIQDEFLLELLKKCKENDLHTAVESCGYVETERITKCLPYLDLVFYDVKQMDDEIHRELTGVSNKLIIENLKVIAEKHSNINVRIPVVPGCNDSKDNIERTAELVASLNIPVLELLPYHNLGENKYWQLGREYKLHDVSAPSKEYMQELAEAARNVIGSRPTIVKVGDSI